MTYEEMAYAQYRLWKDDLLKESNKFNQLAKNLQNKINTIIPQKVHDVITISIKQMVRTVLVGTEWTTKKEISRASISLKEREELLTKKQKTYTRLASAEGAGTGAGGFLIGLADFPLLLSIKIRFLYEVASLYGYDVRDPGERLFILYIFQLAFSSETKRKETFHLLKEWGLHPILPGDFDWQTFQQEYRDSMDIAKLLQFLPGIGAVVGAVVNYRLLDHLATTAKQVYRMRYFQNKNQAPQ